MRLIGFNYAKVSINKKTSSLEDLKINSGINILSVEESKAKSGNGKDSILTVKWRYNISYKPDVAELLFEGNMLIALEKEKADKVIEDWKENKVSEEFNLSVLNVIIKKVSIKAAQFEDDFNLPVHFKLPSLKVKKSE